MESNQKQFLQEYLHTMSEKELKGYQIAKSHLGNSFQLEKSVGFLDWVKQKKNPQEDSVCAAGSSS